MATAETHARDVREGQVYEQATPPPGYPPYRLTIVRPDAKPGWWWYQPHVNRSRASLQPVQEASLLNERLYRLVEPEPAPPSPGEGRTPREVVWVWRDEFTGLQVAEREPVLHGRSATRYVRELLPSAPEAREGDWR